MSQYEIQSQDDPYSALLSNHNDELAWRKIFGNKLDTTVCTIIIRERWDYKLYGNHSKSYRETEDYEREVCAYC